MRQAPNVHNSVFPVLQNVKVKDRNATSLPPLSLHDLLRESLTFTLPLSFNFILLIKLYVGRSSCKVSYFFFSGMEADRNVKVVGGDVAVL